MLAALLAAAAGCAVGEQEFGQPVTDDERFLAGCGGLSGCEAWRCMWAECAVQGVIWGSVGCLGGVPGVIIGGLGGVTSCEWGIRGELQQAFLDCDLENMTQPLTGTAGAPCYDPEDPMTWPELSCRNIIDDRTWERCSYYEVDAPSDHPDDTLQIRRCEDVLCGDTWNDDCQHDYDDCLDNTVDCNWDEEEDEGSEDDGQGALACAMGPVATADADGDGTVTVNDAWAIMRKVDTAPPLADINGDGEGNEADRDFLIEDLLGVKYGDANLDGEFSSADWVAVMQTGLYETGEPALWQHGDFDGNGKFDTSDLVLAMSKGCYEQGPDCT